jgi:hypothetical protein
MLFKGSYIVLSVAALAEGLAFKKQQLRDLVPDRVVRRQADATCLAGNAVQTGSQNGGQDPPVDGQSVSATYVLKALNRMRANYCIETMPTL